MRALTLLICHQSHLGLIISSVIGFFIDIRFQKINELDDISISFSTTSWAETFSSVFAASLSSELFELQEIKKSSKKDNS